jgi:hypothetical protein
LILKLNCWISSKGISENRFTFPYKARCSSGFREFNNKNDVWDEILKIAYETEKAGFDAIGESCYFESLYFANNSDLIDPDSQSMIKTYLYTRESFTPPFQDLNSTPASFIDQFMIVRNELNYIHNQELKEKQNNGK